MMKYSINYHSQRGAALVVSLIILLAMTLLAITSMKSSSTEVAMAGNLRESGLTFQAAEAGLRSAENVIETTVSNSSFDGSTVSRLGEFDPDPDYTATASWTNATDANINLTSVGVSTPPQYIVKYLGKNAANPLGLINIGGGYGENTIGKIVSVYRATARGNGQTGNTFRVLQSHYGIEYGK